MAKWQLKKKTKYLIVFLSIIIGEMLCNYYSENWKYSKFISYSIIII